MTQPEEPQLEESSDEQSQVVEEQGDDQTQAFDWAAQARLVGQTTLRGLREIGIIAITALVLSVTLRTFFFQLFYVPSESMLNTLLVGDKIVASKITKTLQGVHRGDVIVFHDPGGWLGTPVREEGWRGTLNDVLTTIGFLPSNSGEDLVKRVVAVAGDEVKCCSPSGNISINGVELNESAYAQEPTSQIEFDITVPKDSVFVLGDNRPNSRDSRFHLDENSGAVPLSEVRGVVVLKLFPLARFGSVPAPDVLTSLK